METILREKDGITYLECLPESGQVQSEADALELVGACGESGTHRLLLHASNLPESFFRLSSGLAGTVLLKWSIYRIVAAAVLTPEQVGEGRFAEFASETNHGNQFRIFYDRASAEAWLAQV